MRLSTLTLVLLALVTSMAFGQKKGKKTEPVKEQAIVQPAKKDSSAVKTVQKDTLPVNPFIQHYANKYAMAIQWNDYEVAKDALYDLIVENPTNDSLIYDLAIYYYQNKKYAPSVLVCQVLLARNPKNTGALEISAIGYENLGAFDRAQQSYESLYLVTNNIGTLYKIAFIQYRLKRYKECLTSTEILMASKEADSLKVNLTDNNNKTKEYPIKVALYNLKGQVAADQGDKITAKKYYEQALTISPDYEPAKDNLTKLK